MTGFSPKSPFLDQEDVAVDWRVALSLAVVGCLVWLLT